MKELENRKKEIRIISIVALAVLVVVIICLAVSCQHKNETTPTATMETLVPAETIKQETTSPTDQSETTAPVETTVPEETKETEDNKTPDNKHDTGHNTGNNSGSNGSHNGDGNNSGGSGNKSTNPPKPTQPPVKPTEPPKPTQPPVVPTTPPEVTDPPATEPPAPTECPHRWDTIEHPEEGHTEYWCVCDCGQKFKTTDEWIAHSKSITDPEDRLTNHGGWYNQEEWVVDHKAWTEYHCPLCGATK